jgi:DNA modification methylase
MDTNDTPKPINLPIERLIADDINANRGTARGAAAIEDSIRKYGAGRSILIDRNGKVIAGNKTLERAKALGFKDVIVVRTDGTKIVAVKRADLDMDGDPRARELGIADNRSHELSLDWDPEALAKLQGMGVALEKWFTEKELDAILGAEPAQKEKSSVEELVNKAAELQKKWGTAVGQMWAIESRHLPGQYHRLLIGDSTDQTLVKRLFLGRKAAVMTTDPPYGVAYVGQGKSTSQQTIANDDLDPAALANFLTGTFRTWDREALAPGSIFYICHADGNGLRPIFERSIQAAGWHIDATIAWVKQQGGWGWMDFRWQHEPIIYGWKPGAEHFFCGDPNLHTVWEIDRPTQKPVELFARMMQYSSRPGDIVAEPFSGSGSACMAAEACGRICFCMELEPSYAAVLLERAAQDDLVPVRGDA